MTNSHVPARRAGGARLAVVTCLVALASAFVGVQRAAAADVLILDTTVAGGVMSLEAQQAVSLGLTVDVVNAATWASLTTAQFASYRAIVLGDPNCVTNPSPLAAAEANRAVWGAAVTGNVIVVGTDPAFHRTLAAAVTLTNRGIAFAAGRGDGTGLYATLSCYYSGAGAGTAVPVLDRFGAFAVRGQAGGCPDSAHIVSTHPALAGLSDAALSNWGCSTHEAFEVFPGSFEVLAINRELPTGYRAPDGTLGGPYILAQSALDHFTCYTVREKRSRKDERDPIVVLTDQFGTSRAVVKKAEELCAPADKNREGISDPRAHLTCYAIRDDKRSKQRPGKGRGRIEIENQFGEQRLKLRGADTLCVPSSKSLVRKDPGPPPAQLDHFKCYDAKGEKRGPREVVALEDQFGRMRVKVGRVALFCNPVDKNDEGILRPDRYLVCYEIDPRKRVREDVIVRNQFGLAFLRVKKAETLCVPSRQADRRRLPDLTIDIPDAPIPVTCSGMPVTCVTTVRFTISNRGLAPVPTGTTFEVFLASDPGVTKTVSVTLSGPLAPGGSLPMQTELMPPSGNCYDPDCTIGARVDSTNVIDESNEGNNTDTWTEIG